MYITILTFVVVVVWISLTIYRNLNPTEKPDDIKVIPIEGSFDFETVERLKTRLVVPADFSSAPQISTPSPTISQARTASPSSVFDVNTIPFASPSGANSTSASGTN